MSLGEAWDGSAALRWLLRLAGALVLAATIGIWALFGQVSHMTGQLGTFMDTAKTNHDRYDRYIERSSAP